MSACQIGVVKGSSPLSRGIPGKDVPKRKVTGIIPALAGNTAPDSGPTWIYPDHPRSRGEYVVARKGLPGLIGSSPLSRGIRMVWELPETPVRIIPALAGNT